MSSTLQLVTTSRSLRTLILEAVNLESLSLGGLTALEHLEFRRCEGTKNVLSRAMLSGGLMLKILRLVVTEQSDSYLAQFLV